jgi:hypothetical protein
VCPANLTVIAMGASTPHSAQGTTQRRACVVSRMAWADPKLSLAHQTHHSHHPQPLTRRGRTLYGCGAAYRCHASHRVGRTTSASPPSRCSDPASRFLVVWSCDPKPCSGSDRVQLFPPTPSCVRLMALSIRVAHPHCTHPHCTYSRCAYSHCRSLWRRGSTRCTNICSRAVRGN